MVANYIYYKTDRTGMHGAIPSTPTLLMHMAFPLFSTLMTGDFFYADSYIYAAR